MQPAENMSEQWIEVGKVEDIPVLGSRIVRTADGDIAVFRNAEDEVFALRDKCPHKGGPLSQGIVYGRTVTCPMHNWCIHMDSGEAVSPDEGCASSFPVRVDAGLISIQVTPLAE